MMPPNIAHLAGTALAALLFGACTGTEPADSGDSDGSPYTGGWPTYEGKDALGSGSFDAVLYEGVQFPRFSSIDQHGEQVDVYDFAGHSVPVVVEILSPSVEGYRDMGTLLATGRGPLADAHPELAGLRDAVADGEVMWIRLVSAGRAGADATPADVEDWAETYPVDQSPVLLDPEAKVARMFNLYWGDTRTDSIPSNVVLDGGTMGVVMEPDDAIRNMRELFEGG